MNKKYVFLAVFFFLLLYFATIGFRPLFTPDETRYGQIARELIVHNDWVVPKINNLRYFEKPIMGHWLNALSMLTFGENEFAVRFSSALSVLLAALLLWWLTRKYGEKLAAVSTGIFLSSGLVFAVGTYAVLDGPFTLFVTGTLVCFFLGSDIQRFSWKKFGLLALAGSFCGAAFMTKGFLAFAVPALTIVPYMIWEKRWKEIFILPWIPLVFVIIVSLPWAIMVHLRDNDFWNYFFWVEHVQRFLKKEESQHPERFWFFIPVIIGGALPWMLLLPALLKGYQGKWREYFQQPLLRFALCWLVFPFLLFSASSGKLATYILPCFPALAILIAYGLIKYFDRCPPKIFNVTVQWMSYALFSVAGVFFIFQLLVAFGVIPVGLYSRHETWQWLVAVAAVLAWAWLLRLALKAGGFYKKTAYFACGAMAAMFVVHFVMPGLVVDKKAPGSFLARFAGKVDKNTTVVCYKNLVTSVCWYYKRDNVYVYDRGGELEYGLNKPDAKGRLVSKEEFAELVKDPSKYIVIIMNSKRLMKELPESKFKIWEKGMLFQEYNGK
ncbi:MAG: phospholipid carrier-dependent glycosyltransferase [Victivallaceae bacterium]